MSVLGNFEDFYNGYVDGALWSSTDEDGIPLDAKYGFANLADETICQMRDDCQDFFNENKADLESVGNYQQHGIDFWLSRNGHGAGFWDRGNGEIGERLHKAAQAKGSKDLYIGDDGFIYMT